MQFHGRLPELEKQAQIVASDVLVLPSDRSNEAFGIVQLEAMAAGRIALAFDQPRSGMGWVGQLSGLPWSQSPEGLGGAAAVGGSAPDAKPDEPEVSGPLHHLVCSFRLAAAVIQVWRPVKTGKVCHCTAVKGLR